MGLKKFIKNIYFLQKYSLEKEFRKTKENSINKDSIRELIDTIQPARYGINIPNILDTEATIKKLQEGMNIARFGDAELALIEGKDVPFQKSSPSLSARLEEVLSSNNPKIGIAIPRILYSAPNGITQYNWEFWQRVGPHFRDLLTSYLNMDITYYPTEVSLFASYSTKEEKFDSYFQSIRKIWQGKNIHLIYGKGIFDHFTYDIFDNAKSVSRQEAPSKDAFEQYKTILENALKVDPKKLVIIILGPTATVLAYDLTLKGYQALDLGHIAKSYDWWKKGKDLSSTSACVTFFSPD